MNQSNIQENQGMVTSAEEVQAGDPDILTHLADLEIKRLTAMISIAASETETRVSDNIRDLLQSFFNKIIDRVEDPSGRFLFKSLSSFIKGMIGIYDHIGELELHPWPEQETHHAKNYKSLRRQILQVFLMHDLEPVSPPPGEMFEPRSHRAVGMVESTSKDEEMNISHCTRDGFRLGQVVVRPAEVIIKKYRKKTSAAPDTPPWKNRKKHAGKKKRKNIGSKPRGEKTKQKKGGF